MEKRTLNFIVVINYYYTAKKLNSVKRKDSTFLNQWTFSIKTIGKLSNSSNTTLL